LSKTYPHRSWAEINLTALRFNLRRLSSIHDKPVIGVVKANAYGHGLYAVAQSLVREGVKLLAVTNVTEAVTATQAAPKADVLILSPFLSEEIPMLVKDPRWITTLSDELEYKALEKEASRQRQRIRVHLKVDTGMGRLGGFPEQILELFQKVNKSPWIRVAGIFSHLASADIDQNESLAQMRRLRKFCYDAQLAGLTLPPVHFQNSAGTLRINASDLVTWVRPGLSLYGIPNPLASWKSKFGDEPLRPVLSWKARVALIREMPSGSNISYAHTYQTKRKTRVAVLSVGYADGVFRKLSNRGAVLIQGKRCPILGRVTMDMIMVDISKVSRVRWGDEVVLIGKSGKDEINAQEFSEWAETSPYEVLCNIGRRVVRIPV
jgi:alanine racemase